MGISTKKQTQKSNTTEKATTTPTVAPWMEAPLKEYTGKVSDFLGTDPSQYVAGPTELQQQAFGAAKTLGGTNADLAAATEMAKTAAAAGPNLATSSGYNAPKLGNAAQAGSVSIDPTANAEAYLADAASIFDNGGVQRYVDPALESYVDPTLAAYDDDAARSRAALAAQAAKAGAFGGSRFGIRESQFEADTDRGRALTEADLRRSAYESALQAAGVDAGFRNTANIRNADARTSVSGQNASAMNERARAQAAMDLDRLIANMGASNQFKLAQADIDQGAAEFGASAANRSSEFNAAQQEAALQRALEAAGLTANIANTADAGERADVALQADLGEIERLIQQAQLGAPITQLQTAGQLYGVVPPGTYTGSTMTGNTQGTSTTKSKGSLFDMALAAASVAAASDRRLKENIERVGELPDGLGVYEWDYRRDMGVSLPEGRFRGVMADEVAQLRPWALGPELPGGFATVNYSALEAA